MGSVSFNQRRAKKKRQNLSPLQIKLKAVLKDLAPYSFRECISLHEVFMDFYCHEIKTAIIIDGNFETKSDKEKILRENGIHVIQLGKKEIQYPHEIILLYLFENIGQ
ncbi:hypothetical protein COB57_05225 [Candidatus Peregrinibacteria bacterium]|nr:MAG: hypothetical protein COB57_05225 [Candidatus Peregrinibacteria bacterium]